MTIPDRLILREIQAGDRVTGLSLGEKEAAPLKTFLRKCAKEFHRANVARTYVLVSEDGDPRVWGYITLMCSEIKLGNAHTLEDCEAANRYNDFPAVKIARLAVDQRIRGRGYGDALVQFAISISLHDIMPRIGCRFLVAESKAGALSFYTRIGFTVLDTEQNKQRKLPVVFIDLHKLH